MVAVLYCLVLIGIAQVQAAQQILRTNHIYIDITAVLRAVFHIARVLACNISYLPEGASPRRRYFRIARRAPRARVLYDFTARMHEDDIVYIHQQAERAGIALKTKYSPLVDILICTSLSCEAFSHSSRPEQHDQSSSEKT